MLSGLFGGRRRRGLRFGGAMAGAAAGAGFMYFLDPRRGAARRADVAQRTGRLVREVEGTVEAGARDIEHRARGIAHEARARIRGERPLDEVLVERVRAKLGRLTAHPSAIEAACRDGRVELTGPVLQAEHGRIVRGVRMVRGVRAVEDRLEAHESAAGILALQGARPLPGPVPELLQRTPSPGMKLLAGAAALLLLGRALLGRGLGRLFSGIAGAALLGSFLSETERGSERKRLAHRASAEGSRERAAAEEAASHAGAWHPGSEAGGGEPREQQRGSRGRPEVREVKSPAELEPGIAHGSPEPTFGDRVDRPGHRAGSAAGERAGPEREGAAGQEGGGALPGSADVAPHAGFESGRVGSTAREELLGKVAPREERATDAEEPPPRRDPGVEGE